MKKKVFSLMMMLLLAFVGVAKAEELTVHDGTTTSYYIPGYVAYYDDWTRAQHVFPADDLATMAGGQIQSIKWYTNSSNIPYTTVVNVNVYVTEVANTGISDYVPQADCQVVYTGTLSFVSAGSGGECVVEFSTPYTYNGGNLLIGIDNLSDAGYKFIYFLGETVSGASIAGSNGSATGTIPATQRNFLPKTTFDYTPAGGGGGGGGAGSEDQLHVKYMDGEDEIIDQLNLGVRPAGCWMEPFHFTMYSDGHDYTVTVLDFTPSDGMFEVGGEELPFEVVDEEGVELTVGTTSSAPAGVIERQFVAITEGDRAAHIWPIVVEMYEPEVPDVVELAYNLDEEENDGEPLGPGFSYEGVPAEITPTVLHNDYTLPFPEIPEAPDAVYKFSVDEDVILNAYVGEEFENGKVALYTEDFNGEAGPMATNNYTGLAAAGGGGAAGAPFEVQIGEGTTTTGYFPFYTLYNYSIAENLYLASELTEAGVTTAPMTSLSWYATNAPGYEQQGITIWMANVEDAGLTTTSHVVTGMTKVYTGAMTPEIGWNEFEFNEGSFAWDGHSNVLIYCQRNNGAWNSTVSWQATASMPFNAMAYQYQDSGAYDPTIANTMYTSTTRPNIIMKADGSRSNNREIYTYGFEDDLEGWTVMNIEEDEGEWIHSSDNPGGYDYTELAHSGTGFAMSYSYDDYVGVEYNTDSYLISPQKYSLGENATLTFFYDYGNDDYPDYFEVGVATDDEPDEYSFDYLWSIDDERGHSHSNATVRHINNRYENWREVTIDLSDYAGEDVWITFHHQDMDMYEVWIDDVTINTTGETPVPGGDGEISYGPVITNLPLTAGTYYLVASAGVDDAPTGGGSGMGNEEGLRASLDEGDFVVYINIEAMPCPAIEAEDFAFDPAPADDDDEIEPASVTLHWNVPEYATGWRLIFGSTYHPEPTHPQTVIFPDPEQEDPWCHDMANSYTVRNLWNNTNYFWRVEFNNGACPDGVSSPVWGFTTHLNVPANLTVENETVFDDEEIVLNWDAVVDRTYRFYNIYRSEDEGETFELIGNTEVNNIGATTYTDGPLDYNIDPGYTYYVTAVYDEGESAPSDPVNVKVSGYGDIDGHVWEQDGETGIAGATVIIGGVNEYGAAEVYTFTTNAQGFYSGHVHAGTYVGVAQKDGYQTATEPVQGNPFDIDYDETTSPIDYILDENFDPVCGVIAEYYPDSLDPASPYVKVYWGCGLPGSEIIEDFETGDFSKFDWQLSSNYPWAITTNNPYEGLYCMKSTGEGVANLVSDMSVTVEIPADGDMSFFAKISCENSWDYGYFYIDGVQKGSFTGAGNWVEKTYAITAGEHTFKWSYTKDSSVNSDDDCFYVDYITFFRQPEPPIPGMTYDFENSTMQGWTSVDADGDGYGWYVGSEIMTGQTGHDGSNDFVLSQSYYMGSVLYPDNYLVSPQVQLGGIVRFYACAQDASYAAEHFGLAVSTTGTNPSDFTMVQEWTMTAKDGGDNGKPVKGSRSGRAQGTWYEYTVDLSSYSGMGYVAIRHFNCSDMFYLNVDDITIGEPGKGIAENRSLHHYRVYRTNCYNDGPYTTENTVLLASVWVPDTVYIDVEWADLEPGVYKWGVGSVYEGNRGEEETREQFTYTFEGGLDNWSVIDVNAGEGTWIHSNSNPGGYDYTTHAHSGTGFAMCYSFVDNVGAYDTDSYLVSPQKYSIDNGSTITFYADNANDSYPENFSVCVATAANPTASDFTQIWNGGAKGTENTKAEVRHMSDRYDNWRMHSIDLSAYAGQEVWIAFHDVNYDAYEVWIDDVTINAGGGVGPTPGPGSNELQLPRESEIVWSNCLDKDMYLNGVTVNVLLNSADSPEGTTVDFVNLNEYEQQNYPIAQLTLDESGFYAFDSFRRGDYAVQVRLDGYEPIDDTVSIWSDTDLRYVMTEILYGVGEVYVSRTGWAMWDGSSVPNGGQGGGQGGNGSTFDIDFEGGMPEGWTVIDGNNDGWTWCLTSAIPTTWTYYESLTLDWYHSGNNAICSGSYINGVGALTPNEYFVSPELTLVNGSTLNFWAAATDASYPADHFGVFVSDNGTDWTSVQEWTLTAKKSGLMGGAASRNGEGMRLGTWYQYSVDLSAYAGQKYVAFRHFNCTDQYIMVLDDIELTTGAKNDDRHFEYYKVMCTSIDGEPIFNHNTVYPFCQLTTDMQNSALVEGEHYLCKVAVMYSTGMSEWSEPVEWEYEPCDHWGPVDEVTVDVNNLGNHIEWVFEHGFNPYGGDTPTGTASTFDVDFESGMPEGWTVIDGNNDGWTWCLTSAIPTTWTYYASMTLDWYHSGSNAICSGSYINGVGALTPNEYLVSPLVNLAAGSTLSFWVAATDASYPADHFGVFVSADGNDWTSVQEWTLTAKKSGLLGGAASRNGEGLRLGTWYNYSVDLSAYAGQKYVAFRHFNCTDQYIMCLDDITLTAGSKGYTAMNSGMVGDTYAFNITDIANFDERVYFLYKLVNDSRFDVIQGEAAGMFMISANSANLDLESAVNDFIYTNNIEFGQMDKVQAADVANAYKAQLPAAFTNSLMMDVYMHSRENNLCELGAPFCTDEGMYEFPAGVNAGSGETGPDYDCLYTQPNPAWYYMKMSEPGDMDIYMYSTPSVDIDFCCWGPFDDPFSPCPNGLTEDKVVSCSYSINATEHCMIPATAQTGEYYILVITNYSNQACNINFSKVAGSGTTDCTIVVPTVDIIGFLITQDGEYLAFAGPDDREYTDIDEFGDHEYCVRPIYPGEMILPDHNYGWSMGCPVCAFSNGQITCEPGEPIHAEELHATDQVKVWWGVEPIPPMEDWIYYDDGVYADAVGTGGSTVYWAAMFPAASIIPYAGTNLTKVAMYVDPTLNTQTVTASIYLGGSNAPQTMVSTQNFTPQSSEGFQEVNLNTPVGIDGTQNLWIVFSEYGTYPATGCVNTGDANGRWISVDGVEWEDVSVYDLDYTWMIRGFLTNVGKGGMVENIALDPVKPATVETSGMTLRRYGRVESTPADLSFMNRAELVTYNVYRSDDNYDYDLIGTVPFVAGQTYYEYIDTPEAAGTYYYQVKAEYSNGCESDGAPAFDYPDQDYVTATVTGMGENDSNVAIYPNPTSGNVTIEAAGMSRITVVSVLGQVVFDTELNADNYTLNMGQFNAGMYVVRVYSESGVTVKRVTVMQ